MNTNKKKNTWAVIGVVGAFIAMTAALFAIIISFCLQFGIDDKLFGIPTDIPETPIGTDTVTTAPPTNNTDIPVTPQTHLPTPTPTKEDDSWLLKEGPDGGKSYQDSLVFLGDSTTYGMIKNEALSGGTATDQVWYGTEGNTLTFSYVNTKKITVRINGKEESMLIKDAAARLTPSTLVITLGVTGGVSTSFPKEGFIEVYTQLIESILEASPETKIIIQSIYPVASNLGDEYKDKNGEFKITNEKIIIYNGYIKELCREMYLGGKSVYFLDTYDKLLGDDGFLKSEYQNGDGLHISKDGFNIILSAIRKHQITK